MTPSVPLIIWTLLAHFASAAAIFYDYDKTVIVGVSAPNASRQVLSSPAAQLTDSPTSQFDRLTAGEHLSQTHYKRMLFNHLVVATPKPGRDAIIPVSRPNYARPRQEKLGSLDADADAHVVVHEPGSSGNGYEDGIYLEEFYFGCARMDEGARGEVPVACGLTVTCEGQDGSGEVMLRTVVYEPGEQTKAEMLLVSLAREGEGGGYCDGYRFQVAATDGGGEPTLYLDDLRTVQDYCYSYPESLQSFCI